MDVDLTKDELLLVIQTINLTYVEMKELKNNLLAGELRALIKRLKYHYEK